MGKIMKDGISYSGSTYTGGTDIEITGANVINAKVRELTQAQYDALSSAEKNNGTTYYITDGIPSVIGVTDVKANGTSIVSNHVANIPLVSSANNGLVPQGSSVTTQSQTTKFLREDGNWAAPSYTSVSDRALIDGSNIANPSAFRSAINAVAITTDYGFEGTPDSNRQLVTNCPLSYYPFCVINPTRAGWLYAFTYNINLSTQYWCIQILSTSTPSGTFKGDIVAIKR